MTRVAGDGRRRPSSYVHDVDYDTTGRHVRRGATDGLSAEARDALELGRELVEHGELLVGAVEGGQLDPDELRRVLRAARRRATAFADAVMRLVDDARADAAAAVAGRAIDSIMSTLDAWSNLIEDVEDVLEASDDPTGDALELLGAYGRLLELGPHVEAVRRALAAVGLP